MALDELLSEEKSLKAQKIITAVFIGVMIGVAVWAATHKGGFVLPVALLIIALQIGYQNSQNMKSVQAEISRKNAVG